MIYQAPGSNALETADNVYAALEQLKKSFPADVDYTVPFEAVTIIKVSMQEVVKTLLKALGPGGICGISFSAKLAFHDYSDIGYSGIHSWHFLFFYSPGFTINTLTMFGFVLAIGIVVDDAIIVVEAVQHYIDEQHMSPKEATYRAMKDISAPVVAIALILAAVFVPVGFIPGIVGQIVSAVCHYYCDFRYISAFVALSLTPALCTLLLRPTRIDKKSKGT